MPLTSYLATKLAAALKSALDNEFTVVVNNQEGLTLRIST